MLEYGINNWKWILKNQVFSLVRNSLQRDEPSGEQHQSLEEPE